MEAEREIDRVGAGDRSTIVATYRPWPKWERGLLVINEIGITYVPVARSGINLVVSVAVAAWFVFTAVVAATGGFIGFLPSLVVVMLILLASVPFNSAIRKRALSQERLAASHGLSAVSPLEGGCAFKWSELTSVNLPRRGVYKFQATSHKSRTPILQVLAKGSALPYSDRKTAAAAVRDAVNAHAPQLVER